MLFILSRPLVFLDIVSYFLALFFSFAFLRPVNFCKFDKRRSNRVQCCLTSRKLSRSLEIQREAEAGRADEKRVLGIGWTTLHMFHSLISFSFCFLLSIAR
ncbi:hypothetical protein [Phaffia rhodozyma]|uniref:Uncharacterized protein n=1 Tax=Phaffia rhodozyma TaxID=264483 RepID=A0A0F7SG66_PHARH|nr:hypothetical protein [Phaffia rhodozyma]